MNTDTATIKSLLSHVSSIAKKYDEIAALTGENFNIFSVMKLESDEVRLHSRLLGELLNPYGKHGMNEVFLKLFIKSIGLEDEYTHETYDKVEVIVEENIGNISDDYEKGGRIDIVVKFKSGKDIVIENKIYAKDQYKQLARYKSEYPNSNIIYLTLDGRNPDNSSIGEKLKLESIKIIAYSKEILIWLEQCHEKTTNYPLLRETIKQYIYLIKKLTNQTTNKSMENEIKNTLLQSAENLMAAEKINQNYVQIKLFVKERFMDFFKWKLKDYGYEMHGQINDFFYTIEFDLTDKDLFLGIKMNQESKSLTDVEKEKQRNIITSKLNSFKEDGSSSYWPSWFYPSDDSMLKHNIIENMEAQNLYKFYSRIEEETDLIAEYFSAILNELKNNSKYTNL